MKILITGKGKSGSWLIRGEQLGAAIGAQVVPKCTDFAGADVVVVVKRVLPETLKALAGKPWVYDIVDAWPQPIGNAWGKDQAISWLRAEVKRLQPAAMVFPTSLMLADSGFTGPALVLPHHAWPKYQAKATRRAVEAVGYEGGAYYLGAWDNALRLECARRGWRFEVNGDLQQADIGIALRTFDGYPARAWKANTKLANLQALGIPAICSPEESYREFGSGREVFAETAAELPGIFDRLTDYGTRAVIAGSMLAATPRIEMVAKEYAAWLSRLRF